MSKQRKPLSELQKAVLLEGQLIHRCSCTTELIKLLREYGHNREANEVASALMIGRSIARNAGKAAVEKARTAKLLEKFHESK